mmetsp:Transcript_15697/g.33995  ORF Transcript_15697/g.33995 Transcript_15697/m.33995 type:complete len:697 (+) Transcript_15697:209-2299(+)|eukprot:CAMPEP_0172313974 /NCGR_PEP_ID=MMETSP1058-20130122/21374_1 /TAXON_ID=83371 /ORGANISM="Detonula confervacea, Strain CCMP 353" /LENGTH=696 /DNA_ID=CAMNT_0013027719 /DNA_START=171 /DNA_END=2261 /DNA_ORIENTATION=+
MTRRTIRIAAATMLHVSMMHMLVHGFSPSSTTRISSKHCFASNQQLRTVLPTCLYSTGNGGDDEAQRLRDKANQYRAEAEKLQLTLGLKKINDLENDVRDFVKGGDDDDDAVASPESKKLESEKLQKLKDRVQDLVRGSLGAEEADTMLAGLSSFSSSRGLESKANADSTLLKLTAEEVKSAIVFLGTLPTPVKDTLAKTAGYPSYESILNLEEFAQNLYVNKDASTEKLRRLYFESFSKNLPTGTSSDTTNKEKDEEYDLKSLSKLLSSKIEERSENSTRAMELFPRVVQDANEEILPSADDANVVFELLEKSFMATEKPIKVSGGYIIRGKNKRKSASELLDYMDAKVAKANPEWTDKYQLSFVEIYSDATEELFEDAILVSPNKFEPLANKLLAGATTAVALFSSFVYCIDTFGENTEVMQRLKDASELATAGGTYDIGWFNELLIPLLVTLGAAQGFHELAHYSVAWLKQVKLTSPTILPSQALPYLSFQNRIKTSPKGYADLFDIAFVGPLAGLSVSFLAFLVGLQLTTTVDPATVQLLPSLPVGFLTQSTLGGTIVDLVLGGGDGILLNQDAATQVPLHPVAIGGFLGLIIHALDLVPVGSTDGGRMSQAVLGRVWHLTFSSVVFFVLFVASFTSASDSGILLGFLLIYSFTQRDMEIPCRNEIDKVELPRAVAALVSYLLAALILVPLR